MQCMSPPSLRPLRNERTLFWNKHTCKQLQMQTTHKKAYDQTIIGFTCWFKAHGSTYSVNAAVSPFLLFVFTSSGSGDRAEWRRKAVQPGAKSTLLHAHGCTLLTIIITAPQPGHKRPRLYRKSLRLTMSVSTSERRKLETKLHKVAHSAASHGISALRSSCVSP